MNKLTLMLLIIVILCLGVLGSILWTQNDQMIPAINLVNNTNSSDNNYQTPQYTYSSVKKSSNTIQKTTTTTPTTTTTNENNKKTDTSQNPNTGSNSDSSSSSSDSSNSNSGSSGSKK